MIEAHQEGTLKEINDLFSRQENMPNMRQDTIKNPYDNTVSNTNDWSSMGMKGLKDSSVYYMTIPGMNATVPINPNDNMNIYSRLSNLIPSNLITIPGLTQTPSLPPVKKEKDDPK